MRVTVDDAAIDVAADGDGAAIVLIHGFPLSREIWDGQVPALASDCRVIRPDLRGCGESSAPGGPYLMETLAADVAAALDAMKIERAAIVGHSMGGYVAMAFARMYTERVDKLVLVCSRLAADTASVAREREELAARAERENSAECIVNAYIPKLFAPAALERRAPAVNAARTIAVRNGVAGMVALLRGMAVRPDAYDIATDLDMPVLLVAGAADQVVALSEAEEMRRAFPAARLKVLPGSGHLPMLEEPDALTRVLADFLT